MVAKKTSANKSHLEGRGRNKNKLKAQKVMTIKFKDALLEACRDMMVGNIL